jgi:hypothetical protein
MNTNTNEKMFVQAFNPYANLKCALSYPEASLKYKCKVLADSSGSGSGCRSLVFCVSACFLVDTYIYLYSALQNNLDKAQGLIS